MSPIDSASRLLELAQGCGFSDVGIAPPDLPEERESLREWIDAGYAGGMDWIAKTVDVRVDVRVRFPWARSLVVVAHRYRPRPLVAGGGPGLAPYVSMYARGKDYHNVLLPKLEALAAKLKEEFAPDGEMQSHAYVDTGPVMERQMAQAAGLGWLGKNGLLLQPEGGSYVFLGTLVTDLELPRGNRRDHRALKGALGEAAAGGCGTCAACQPACPTNAFVQPGVVDSRRCISYLTIEHKGPIERDLRPAMGGWMFGCDLCQTACPFNHFDEDSVEPAFDLGEAVAGIELPQLLQLDEDEFRQRFRHTPLWRPRREGLIRNALIVAANLERDDCKQAARTLLSDESAVIREAASWYLAKRHDVDAAPTMQDAVSKESEGWARQLMAQDLLRLLSG